MQRYLRRKGFRLTDLALQEESSLSTSGGLEGEEAEDLLTEVQLYLRRKGFGLTDIALLEERCRRSTTFSPFVSLTMFDDYPQAIYQGYEMLRAWAKGSLDEYKHELVSVLYPLFLQCSVDLVARGDTHGARRFYSAFVEDHELMHLEDLYEVKKFIFSETHWKEMVMPDSLKRTKFRVKLCEYSYELLLQYLHRRNKHVMLGLINEKIKFEVSAGQPFVFPLGKETMGEMIIIRSVGLMGGALSIALAYNKVCTYKMGFF
ncbi:hypothetical protein ZWY2020_015014 [Hordeum vulgare]|nr:hypothetical protein ZWY2020_015014 [Hordeum vulgare]